MKYETPFYKDADFEKKVFAILGDNIGRIDYPGGKDRNTIKIKTVSGVTYYATGRPQGYKSSREIQILHYLQRSGVNAPRVLGVENDFFIQSEIPGERLSIALSNAKNPRESRGFIEGVAHSLVDLHGALSSTEARALFAPNRDDRSGLNTALPREAASFFGISAPDYDDGAVVSILKYNENRPIKYDTRPANAILDESGACVWIDWDRTSHGNRLDDLVHLLCDEYTHTPPELDTEIFDCIGPKLYFDAPSEISREYFSTKAVFHCLKRLSLIFGKYSGKREWWDPEICLMEDRVGVAPVYVDRLCEKGMCWSLRSNTMREAFHLFHGIRSKVTGA